MCLKDKAQINPLPNHKKTLQNSNREHILMKYIMPDIHHHAEYA